jgi:hypothetical protein
LFSVPFLSPAEFIDVLFKQLYETHPKVRDELEAAYTVAMLQEMFYQIGLRAHPFLIAPDAL